MNEATQPQAKDTVTNKNRLWDVQGRQRMTTSERATVKSSDVVMSVTSDRRVISARQVPMTGGVQSALSFVNNQEGFRLT